MNVNIQLLPAQKKFVTSKAPHPAICGGLGSGKSAAATMRLILLMLDDTGINTLMGMPTYDLLRLRAIPGVEQDLDKIGVAYKTNKSEYSIEIIGYGFIYFRSYDRPERWVAFECAHTILDELDTLPKDKAEIVWRKASERTRQKCKGINTLANVTTPDQGINGFTYAKWGKNPDKGYELIKASTIDNFYLPDGYIDQITANYDPIMADAYLRGEFVSFNKNKVYHFFKREKHHTNREIKENERLYIGLDFNIGGCCAVVFVIENNNPIAVDEFVSHDTMDVINNLVKYNGHNITLYPDASGRNSRTNAAHSDVQLLEQASYAVDAPDANPFVRDRINAVNSLFSHDRLMVNTNKCPEFANSLDMQGYDDRGEPEKFKEHPAIDDWNDAGGYFLNRKYPIDIPIFYTGIGSAS